MRKFNLMKTVVLFITILAFSNCEENGPIQFIVADDFETSVVINNLGDQSSFTISSSTDISDLLDNADSFVETNIESVIAELGDDYSGTSINGTLKVSSGSVTFLDQSINLTKNPSVPIVIPSNSSDILSLISSGTFPISVSGTTTEPLGDNNFTLKLTFRVKATVE